MMSLFNIHTLRKRLICTAVLCLLLVLVLLAATDTNEKLLGGESDGSRAVPVHLIALLDEEGGKITPDDELLLPFSTRQTCSGIGCHSVETISGGWHFSATDGNITPGRPGQPWILVDAGTGTQLPLSYRPWPGTFRPEQLGLTPWKFTELFGRHMPGGGVGELESDNPDEIMRGFISGKLEINCLSCHNAHPGQDQAEYASQIARQNFRWAAAAACEFASVQGSAKSMGDTYDYLMPPVLGGPTVMYRKNAFDHKNLVFFNIVRKVPAERCYFCHSNRDLDKTGAGKWATDEDVHLAAGLTCVDCHRNGLDHNITRGYEGEESISTNPLVATSSCQGCHISGRLGAPVPEHPGIPPVHFDKLTCTACHSGPWPEQKTYRTKTSRAHGLGTYNVNKSDEALPHIIYPVFDEQMGPLLFRGYLMRVMDNKIAPHKLIWPAFWGSLKDQKVTPIALEIVRSIAAKIIIKEKIPPSGDWPALTAEQITKVLSSLSSQTEGKPAYIAGGTLYCLDDSGKLTEQKNHAAARPYLWPLAHDVRPAAQSLGVRGCEDCHSTDAPFFFGKVDVDSPVVSKRDSVKMMVEFQDVDAVYAWAFALSFVFRPWLKVVNLASCAVLAVVLLLYALKALARITKMLAAED